MKVIRRTVFVILVLFCAGSLVFSGGKKETPADGAGAGGTGASTVDSRPDSGLSSIGSSTGMTRPAVGGRQIVQAGTPLAAMAGFEILQKGGTAFDAAVAIAGVQGITEPAMASIISGDAEIMVWNASQKKLYVYNGTGWAPAAASVDFYLEKGGIPDYGALSVEIPGGWAGWMLMLQDHGTLPLETLMQPMISAAQGMVVDTFTSLLKFDPKVSNQALIDLYTVDGRMYADGDVLKNPALEKTFNDLIAASKRGRTIQDGYRLANEYFYRGPIAETLVRWSKANGGIWELSDFNDFHAEKQEPWSTTYKGYEIFVCPPNCQGPVLLECLNILENYDLQAMGHNSGAYVDLLAQTLNIALQDRNDYYGDPRFVAVPKYLISKEYAKKRTADINLGRAMAEIPNGGRWIDYESRGADTTFLYVADKWGNVVVSTHSICNVWASHSVVPELGVVLNNRMKYFTLDESLPNVVEPRKRTMQTITPTLGFKNGRPAFAVGTPGADTQEQSKLQVILNAIEWGMTNPQRILEQPRFITNHPAGLMDPAQFPKTVSLEPWGYSDEAVKELESYGYTVRWGNTGSTGSLGFAWLNLRDNFYWGGADPRRSAYAIAW